MNTKELFNSDGISSKCHKGPLTPESAVEALKEELGLEMYTILTKTDNLKAKLLEILSTYQGLQEHEIIALDWIYSLYFPKF